MNDPNLNAVLKWSVENSSASQTAEDAPKTQLDPEAVAFLLGLSGPKKSDGKRMEEAIEVAKNKQETLQNRLIALDNFEQLVEQLDNANYMEKAGFWMPLAELMEDEHAGIREYAAWCCGTAVQNNVRTQERLLIVGIIPTLMRLASEDADLKVRRKATTALSSAVRNYQPSLDAAIAAAPAEFKPKDKLDATDMESVDVLIGPLRERNEA